MIIDAIIDQVKQRKNFYRDIYRKELVVLVALIITQIILVGMIMYVATHRVMPDFYSSSSDGILTPLKAMPVPNQSDKALLE